MEYRVYVYGPDRVPPVRLDAIGEHSNLIGFNWRGTRIARLSMSIGHTNIGPFTGI